MSTESEAPVRFTRAYPLPEQGEEGISEEDEFDKIVRTIVANASEKGNNACWLNAASGAARLVSFCLQRNTLEKARREGR